MHVKPMSRRLRDTLVQNTFALIGPLGSPRLRPPSALHCVAPVHARALDQSVRLQALKERTKASIYRLVGQFQWIAGTAKLTGGVLMQWGAKNVSVSHWFSRSKGCQIFYKTVRQSVYDIIKYFMLLKIGQHVAKLLVGLSAAALLSSAGLTENSTYFRLSCQ